MKILVLGAGATGGYYGGRMLHHGADVTFLVRPRRAAQLAERGLVIRSESWPSHAKVKTVSEVKSSEPFDLVLLTCKSYDLDSAMESIAPAVESRAAVLPLMNGLSAYEKLDQRFGRDRVLGGVAYVAVSLDKDGNISQQSQTDTLLIGSRTAARRGTAAELSALLPNASGTETLSASIELALWAKWVMLAAGAAATCLMRGNIGEILRQEHGRTIVLKAIAECRAVAAASGFDLSSQAVASIEARLLDSGSNWAASMMRDIAQGEPRIEAYAIVGDMLRRAAGFRQESDLLRAACCHLQVYEAQRTA